jgi:hypothetical protein
MVVVPIPLAPIAPTLARPLFHHDGWIYEEKVDGWRMLAVRPIGGRGVKQSVVFARKRAASFLGVWFLIVALVALGLAVALPVSAESPNAVYQRVRPSAVMIVVDREQRLGQAY